MDSLVQISTAHCFSAINLHQPFADSIFGDILAAILT